MSEDQKEAGTFRRGTGIYWVWAARLAALAGTATLLFFEVYVNLDTGYRRNAISLLTLWYVSPFLVLLMLPRRGYSLYSCLTILLFAGCMATYAGFALGYNVYYKGNRAVLGLAPLILPIFYWPISLLGLAIAELFQRKHASKLTTSS